jgi:hypothetical protein
MGAIVPSEGPRRSILRGDVDDELGVCHQLMETADRALLDQWMANWTDLVDFEVVPVINSAEATERIAPRL